MSILVFSLKVEDKKFLKAEVFNTPDAPKSTCAKLVAQQKSMTSWECHIPSSAASSPLSVSSLPHLLSNSVSNKMS